MESIKELLSRHWFDESITSFLPAVGWFDDVYICKNMIQSLEGYDNPQLTAIRMSIGDK